MPLNLLNRVPTDFEAWCAVHRVPPDSPGLQFCGAMSINTADSPHKTDDLAGAARRPEKPTPTLTPLGMYGTREYLLGAGCDAPLAAD